MRHGFSSFAAAVPAALGLPEVSFLPIPVVLVAGAGAAWVSWKAGRSPVSGEWATRGVI